MIRVRHYTRVSGRDKILAENRIVARDQNRVFVESANRKPLSPRAAEAKFGIDPGKGNSYVEFDMEGASVDRSTNKFSGLEELSIAGDVDLTDRQPAGFDNF